MKNLMMSQTKISLSLISLMISIFVMTMKFYAFHLTGSQAIFSDALEAIINITAGISLIIVLVISSRPVDKSHPYGHGKVEYFASTFEGGGIFFAGILIVIEAISAFLQNNQLQDLNMGILITILAGVINGLLGYYLKYRGEKEKSVAISANGKHLLADFWTSVAIFFGLLFVKFSPYSFIDPLIAIFVGGYLCIEGYKVLSSSLNNLLDAEDPKVTQSITDLLNDNYREGMIQVHSTRTIRSGNHHHIDLHIVVPEFWSIEEGHNFGDNLEKSFLSSYDYDGEFHLHLDPCNKEYCARCELSDCEIRQDKFKVRRLFTPEEIILPDELIIFTSD